MHYRFGPVAGAQYLVAMAPRRYPSTAEFRPRFHGP